MSDNYISCQEDRGSINISEDVVLSLVRAAVDEIDGVAAINSGSGTELGDLLGIKSPSRGLKVSIQDGVITVDVVVTVRYGSNVVNVARQVQDSITAAVESMTGMGAPVVNVHVSGVAFEK